MQKEAVLVVTAVADQFISSIFAVPMKDGSHTPVVNLKPLNLFIQKAHFKMEGVHMVKDLLWRNMSIDQKDAYLSVPVAPEHRKFLRFKWKAEIHEFQCLPFGLSSTPRTFTKILKPVMAVLRQRGMRSIVFINDLLLMAQYLQELLKQIQEVLQFLQLLDSQLLLLTSTTRGYEIPNLSTMCCAAVAMVFAERHNHLSRASTWSEQSQSRLGVTNNPFISRVDATSSTMSMDYADHGSMQGRSICYTPQHSIHQLEAGPICSAHGCLSDTLDIPKWVCFPPILYGGETSSEGQIGEKLNSTDCN